MEKRTTEDLVNELREEAKGVKIAALIIGFEKETKYIFSNSLNPLDDLNALIEAGGEPVGIMCVITQKNKLNLRIRPLKEYADEEWIHTYLDKLGFNFIKAAKEMLGAELSAYSSGEVSDIEEGGGIGNC
jgi:hypothetical protein